MEATNGTSWDDMADDTFDDVRPADLEVAKPISVDSPLFIVRCSKCGGSGRFGYSGRLQCFACAGKGTVSRKTNPVVLAKAKAKRQAAPAERFAAFTTAHPEAAAWIERSAATFSFAQSMREAIEKFGALTERQMAAVERCVEGQKERNAQREAQRAIAVAAAPVTDAAALEACFGKALARGLASPKLRLGNYAFAPAKATGRNPGAIYVTERTTGAYLGKVMGGKLQLNRDAAGQTDAVLATIADPEAAAVAYGKTWGKCAICNRDLSDADSVARGIGPICADKFF